MRVLLLGTLVFVALTVRAERADAAVATQSAAAQHCFAGPCYWISVEVYGTGTVESTVSDNLQKIMCPASGGFACTTEDWFNWADFMNPGIIRLTPTPGGSGQFFGWDGTLGHACLHITPATGVCELRQADFGAEGTEGWCMVARFGPSGGPPNPNKTAGNCANIPQQPVGRPVVVRKAGTGSGTVLGPDAFSCNAGCQQESESFGEGRFLSFSATAASGSHFVGWSGNMGCSTNPCGFTMPCGNPDPGICPNPSETLPSITATFTLNSPPPPPPPPPRYNTVLLNHPPKTTRSRRATFGWGAKLNGSFRSSFKSQCKLGSKPWATCRPGKTYTGLSPGLKTFRVRVAQPGTTRWDTTPAIWTWKIRK
jgi:Divergent InlB B-repeat domain